MNLFFDTETTGVPLGKPPTSPVYPWPVEIAGILTTLGGAVVSSFRVVIRPDDWRIPEDAVQVHGIDTPYAHRYGKCAPEGLSWNWT